MIVKSLVLRPRNVSQIAGQCSRDVIAVVRPEKALESLLREAARKEIIDKQPATAEMKAVSDYFGAVSANPAFLRKKDEFVEYVHDYLQKGKLFGASLPAVEDYILAQCALLCAEAVASCVDAAVVLDGRELVVCRMNGNVPVFDWSATVAEIKAKCQGPMLVAGGYARTFQGIVVRVGKGGANLLASLIASAIGASRIEFFVEGDGIKGIPQMTYDEAAHYCAGSSAPFPSSSLWPAKNAGIPIWVKSIQNDDFAGTLVSSEAAHTDGMVSGVIDERDLVLVTVYGTGLLGTVGVSSSIFGALASERVNIRFISQTTSEFAITFAVRAKDTEKVEAVLHRLIAENPMLPLDDVMMVDRRVGVITVYGSRMKNVPGVSGNVFSLLGAAGVNVIASAQGGEELSISVVVDEADVETGLAALQQLC